MLSINRFGASAQRALLRFPLTLAAAVAAAVLAVLIIEEPGNHHLLLRLLMTVQLGIPLHLAADLMGERRLDLRLPPVTGIAARAAATAFLAVFFIQFDVPENGAEYIGFLQWNVLAHLLVVVAPFCRSGEQQAFWNYNVALLLRLLNAVLFTLVLYAGLSVALGAVKILLSVEMNERIFFQLFAVLGFVFNTWYFLGGVPDRWSELADEKEPPKALKVFGEYILPPLVGVYLAILTIYLVKVVVIAEWPSGWIGYLVSSVAVAGIFSLLLLYPQVNRSDKGWIRLYARLFHILLIPAVVMMLMAIGKRVGQYGWTEPRYLLLVMAGWLGIMAVVGGVRPGRLLKAIPLSLGLLALLTALGPWGSSAVARHSQLNRLEVLLAANGRVVDGQIIAGGPAVGPKASGQICDILDYLFDSFGPHVLDSETAAPWPDKSAELVAAELVGDRPSSHTLRVALSTAYTEYLGVDYIHFMPEGKNNRLIVQRAPKDQVTVVTGYDFSVDLNLNTGITQEFSYGDSEYSVSLDAAEPTLTITRDSDLAVSLSLEPLFKGLTESDQRPAENMNLRGRCEAFGVEVQVTQAHFSDEADSRLALRLLGVLLVDLAD